MPPPPIPLHSSLAAAIVCCAAYGVFSPYSYALFGVWHYPPYLDSALGAGGKFLGFLFRAIFLSNWDINVFAASTVFIQAGMSACTSAQAAVLGDWFMNAASAQAWAPHASRPRLLPAACRLLVVPILVFGPGIGIPAAVLLYGVRTPDSARTAMTIRKYSAWGTLACIALLAVLALLALALAARRRHERGGNKAAATPIMQVVPMLASVLLLMVSAATRVRSLYDPHVTTDDGIYYSLIVLPELLQQVLAGVPALLHRCGYAERYAGWRTAAWGWVTRRWPVAPGEDPEVAAAAAVRAGDATGAGAAAGGSDKSRGSSGKTAASSAC